MIPATHTSLVGVSMKVEWEKGAPLHLHTQLHTQVLGRLCGGGQGLPSTIVFSLYKHGIRILLVRKGGWPSDALGARFFAYSSLIINFKGVLMKLKIVDPCNFHGIAYFHDFFDVLRFML